MKKTLSSLIAMSTLAIASPAFAHNGETHGFFANIAHWLFHPTHSIAAIAIVAVLALAVLKLSSNKSNT